MSSSTTPEYTQENLRKIAGDDAEFISRERAAIILGTPSGSRSRMYGIHPTTGEIVRLASQHYLDAYSPEHIWINGTTFADLIGRA